VQQVVGRGDCEHEAQNKKSLEVMV
jgi:hypothetical protein